MADFHCPVGAVTKGADECVSCGLCTATTREEMATASAIIRSYVREFAQARLRRMAIKKIAVCGKGGSGKSTITSLMARSLCDYGYRCLVIDTDESNVGLHRKLGIDQCPEQLITCLPRFSIGKETKTDTSWMTQDPLPLSQIPEPFVVRNGDLSFMVSGKIDDPYQGCACTMAEVTKNLMFNLCPEDREIILMDHSAGIESFGRGMEQACDTVLIVVEPSFEAIDLAKKIQYLSESMGVRRIRAIVNKTLDEEQDEYIRDMLAENGIRYLGCVGSCRELAMANLKGIVADQSSAFSKIHKITGLMLDEAEMSHKP